MQTHRFLPLAIGLILAIAGVAAYKMWSAKRAATIETLPIQRCDPGRQRCSARLPDGGNLEFTASPGPIRPLQPFRIDIALSGTSAERIEVDFDGTQMRMGVTRSPLSVQSPRFAGEAMLPVCTTGTMEWSATVFITAKGRTLAIPFHFEVAAR